MITTIFTIGAAWALATASPPAVSETATPRTLTGAPDRSAETPLALTAFTETRWNRSAAFSRLSSSDREQGGGLAAGYDLAHAGLVTFAAGVGWSATSASDTSVLGATAQLDTNELRGVATARLALASWLAPYVTVGAGGSKTSVGLELPGARRLRAERWTATMRAGGGARLLLYPQGLGVLFKRPIAVSLELEGGVSIGPGVTLDARAEKPSGRALAADQLPQAALRLGTLPRTEPYLHLGVGVQF